MDDAKTQAINGMIDEGIKILDEILAIELDETIIFGEY